MCASITDLNDQLPQEYLAQLNELERIICLRASLICWSVTEGTQVPRIMQLRSILADRLGRNRTPEYTDKGWIPKCPDFSLFVCALFSPFFENLSASVALGSSLRRVVQNLSAPRIQPLPGRILPKFVRFCGYGLLGRGRVVSVH